MHIIIFSLDIKQCFFKRNAAISECSWQSKYSYLNSFCYFIHRSERQFYYNCYADSANIFYLLHLLVFINMEIFSRSVSPTGKWIERICHQTELQTFSVLKFRYIWSLLFYIVPKFICVGSYKLIDTISNPFL